jgi:hypothetical protein
MEEMERLRNGVQELINNHDPAQLFQYGAPEDEYKKEIQIVTSFLTDNPEVLLSEITEGIKSIFTKRFSPLTVQNFSEIYDTLAVDLHNLLHQNRGIEKK